MSDLVAALFGVWTPAVLTAAVASGLAFGFAILGPIARWPLFSSMAATAVQTAVLVAVAGVLAGIVFYVGQVTGAHADGDPLWWRIASRASIWGLYAICVGIGAGLSVAHDNHRRTERARRQALQERLRQLGDPR